MIKKSYNIPFNKPYLTGKETHYIYEAVNSGKISGNGIFTNRCQKFFEQKYNFNKCLLTCSCTDALEMCSILIDLKPGDEIIIPSYTFVSTANAFALRGADIIFADSNVKNPNIDADKIENLITEKTKAIVIVHYAGISCDMKKITDIAKKHNLYIIEDAAQAIESNYKESTLGSLGHFSTFSFHETKNITSGEGGMLVINDENYKRRAEIIWEKGTNRAAFWRGEVNKYGWVDLGSSYLPSEIIAAFLYAQIENIDKIQTRRKSIWNHYYNEFNQLEKKGDLFLPYIPEYATNNGHMFYLICNSFEIRNKLLSFLKSNGVNAVFHYQSLHKSEFYKDKYKGDELTNSDRYTDCLLRLPLYFELTEEEQIYVIKKVKEFFV